MIRIPSASDLQGEAEKQRQQVVAAQADSDQRVQNMLNHLGIDYPGGYRSRTTGAPELADVTVNGFNKMASHFGHVGIAVGNDPSRGFYPVQSGLKSAAGFVPGEVRQDDMRQPHTSVTFPTTPAQEALNRRSMTAHSNDEYNLFFAELLRMGPFKAERWRRAK